MKKSTFTEEQIAYALRQVEVGTPPADACRQLGVSEATFYIWKPGASAGTIVSVRDYSVSKTDDLLHELETLTESDIRQFPYQGCRRLQAAVCERHDGLIPDLDSYLSEFAGYRSWGKRILQWSDARIETVEKRLRGLG